MQGVNGEQQNMVNEQSLKQRSDEGEIDNHRKPVAGSRRFERVCVFCGAYSGSRLVFCEAAAELGRELVERKIDLVYGGGSVGLMGMVSQAVSDGGQNVLGVIPKTLMREEITGQTVGKVVPVGSMHERKAEMARLSDAFIALPGGYGTLEELLEVITWSQLGIHDKPVGLLNVDGYYDFLLAFVDNAVREGFIPPAARNIFVAASSASELMQKLEGYVSGHERVASKHTWEMHQREDGVVNSLQDNISR